MTNPFDNAIAVALGSIRGSAGRAVRYGVGPKSIPDVKATVGETRELIVTEEGLRIRIRQRDYHIAVTDLQFDSVRFLPALGHEVYDTIDGVETRFKVTKSDAGDACFRYSDEATRTEFRIHTEERSTCPGP